jgi:cysteine desulfurase
VTLRPLLFGGGQEMNLRSGTENVAGAIGFAKALTLAEKHRASEVKRVKGLRDDLEKFLLAEFPDLQINGAKKSRLPGILNISLPNLDGERALFALDQRGVMVATGSACAANAGLRSHVLTAIGLPPEIADGSLRISLGRPTTREEIETAKPIFAEVLREQVKLGSPL